jgi:hypothetical protein
MLIIQNISKSSPPRTFATFKAAGFETGLERGSKIKIYSRGDILFYSNGYVIPDKYGFEEIAKRKVFFTQNRIHVALPLSWFEEYCNKISHLRAYYTDIGLFLRPFYG